MYYPKYLTGEVVQLGDNVLINQKRLATVTNILIPNTKEAIDWDVPQGGICTTFDDGDCWIWTSIDEDIELFTCDYPIETKRG
jgi:hypothetical protein